MTQLSCKHCESLRKVPQKFTFVTQNFCFWTIPKGLLVYGVGEVIAVTIVLNNTCYPVAARAVGVCLFIRSPSFESYLIL